ncbi:hypothetical protein [Streptomyces melanogenes]|uniref:hypothetical protein n=1 Tax=Streptomyces melanogenes TaxID=67326 RepID=UPI00378F3EBD
MAQVVVLAGVGVCLLGLAPVGGGDGDALRMAVSTNSVSVVGVRVRAGQEIIRTYRLRNFAEYGLRDVRVVDAQAVEGAARCPRASLEPLGSMACRAVVRAVAGRHVGRVVATGVPTWQGYRVASVAVSAGYDARVSELTLERAASQKRLSYRLRYAGPAPLENLRLEDPLLDAAPLRCASGDGLPVGLPSGSDLECWAPAPAQPGRYESVARASGTTADGAVSPAGTPLSPLALAAEAAGGYTVPTPPERTRPAGPGGPVPGERRRLVRQVPPRGPAARRSQPGAPAAAGPRRAGTAPAPGPAAPLVPGVVARLGVPVPPGPPLPPGFSVPGGTVGAAPAGRAPGLPVPAVPTPGALPPGSAVAGRRLRPPGGVLDEGMDWAFISLVVVAFPALLVAVTSVSRTSNSPGERD